ncbi:hypothetical protein KAU19_07485 [Candidatus Parcubacteria bacterium]|nr:hypothetical protein [Candidatus Parcubacteria bacterium]
MENKREGLNNLYQKYVKGTHPKISVTYKVVVLCRLTNQVNKVVLDNSGLSKVYVNTKVLKHLYDKKPAEEFDFIIGNLHKIVKYPDYIYRNKNEKRGDWCFVKKIKNELYISSLEHKEETLEIATVFRIRKEKYLESFELLWSWENDESPS